MTLEEIQRAKTELSKDFRIAQLMAEVASLKFEKLQELENAIAKEKTE